MCFPFVAVNSIEFEYPQSFQFARPRCGRTIVPIGCPSIVAVRIAQLLSVLTGPFPLAYRRDMV